ncbi:MAG: hypothetical protein L0211_04580 [Planctomycetaceae bacterium]|nr:hypothetical protein [Planctomycetaceae bacterium]
MLAALTSRLAVAEEKPVEPVTIKKVVSAKLEVSQGTLTVTAVGEVPTGGYTQPTLIRVTYFRQPDDGIQDYMFRAVPPDGVAAQVISQVTATDKWPALPKKWLKGVRIHGAGNGVLVKMLSDK